MKTKNHVTIDLSRLNRFPDMKFRLVNSEDSEFIWKLRNHDFRSRHLNSVGPTIEDQELWINQYKLKEHKGEEYYFVISDDNNTRQGLYRIYDIKPESAVVGSWIFRDNAPDFMAVRAELMLKEFAFHMLDKKVLYFETRKKNKRIYNYSMMQNSEIIEEDEQNLYFQLRKEDFTKGKEKLKKIMRIDC